jgi:hypothetical protein
MRDNQLKEYSLYNGTVKLLFDEAAHEYYYKDKIVPSTTKIIDETLAKPALKFWAVKTTLEWLKKQILPGTKYTETALENILKQGKIVHIRESEKATTIGSNAHKWIERFVEIVMEDGEKWPVDWESRNGVRLESREAINSVNAFLNWYSDHDVKFIASERKVYSIAYNYSGTFDLFATVDGVNTIIDFKTSKHLYPDYLIQGAGYWKAFEEETKIERLTILRLPKNGENWETLSIDDPEAHAQIFIMARRIFDWSSKDLNNINPKSESSKNSDYKVYITK